MFDVSADSEDFLKKFQKTIDIETDNHYHLVIERSYSLFPNPSIRSRSEKLGATPAKFFICPGIRQTVH